MRDPYYPAGVTDNDPHFAPDPDAEFFEDEHTEEPEPIERSWQEVAAEEACIPLHGAL